MYCPKQINPWKQTDELLPGAEWKKEGDSVLIGMIFLHEWGMQCS